jgi:hypothetical protein
MLKVTAAEAAKGIGNEAVIRRCAQREDPSGPFSLAKKKSTKHFRINSVVLCGLDANIGLSPLRIEHRLRVLRRIFGPTREKVHRIEKTEYEELLCLFCSSRFIRMIRSRAVKQSGHVAGIRGMRNA